jgi:hypothetical protein
MSLCPPFAPFFGFAGVASAVSGASFVVKEKEFKLDCNRWSLAVRSLTSGLWHRLWFEMIAVGAAFGTAKAGIGIAGLGTFKPELIMKVRHRLLWCFQSLLKVFYFYSPSFQSSCLELLLYMDLWFLF